MSNDPAFGPDILRDIRELARRILNLETGSAGIKTVDLNFGEWEETNDQFLPADSVAPWLELRVKNPADGIGQLWRAVPTSTGAKWQRIT